MRAIAVMLAAGKGTRMRSDLPKVLHPFAGEPLVAHPLRAAFTAGVKRCVVVVGYEAAQVEAGIRARFDERVEFALQAEQNGTGHAVGCALANLDGFEGHALILSGDVPLLRASTLTRLSEACSRSGAGMSLASFVPEDPSGYGRIVRDARRPSARVTSVCR